MKKDSLKDLLILRCLDYFLDNPYEKIYLREFSRKIKISPNSAQRFLDMFLKEGLVKEERISNHRYFRANIDSVFFRQVKKTCFLKKIVDSGLIKALDEISLSVVLFGSCAKGLNNKNSDIDLVIISKDKKEVHRIISNFQKKFSQEISPHVFNFSEWRKQKRENKAFYEDVVSEGLTLKGDSLI